MYNFYNARVKLTPAQKRAYLQMLIYVAKADQNPEILERKYIKNIVQRLQYPLSELKNMTVPMSLNDLYVTLRPIGGRAMAIDLLHCLWFVASVDSVIVDDEIKIIRSAARILNISDDEVLVINNFVQDELEFMQRACDILETEEVRC